MSHKYHTAVVGSGSGGLTVAVGLSRLGKSVALIERGHVGGDCTNVGCIPSKTLVYASRCVARGEMTPRQALALVRERRNHLREEETVWVREQLPGVTFLQGEARFRDPHTLTVQRPDGESQAVAAKNIVLATGSRPRHLSVPGLPQERLLSNENLFELEEAPRHLVIVGGGVIGLEMAFCFRRLGSRVTVLNRGERLLGVSEPEVGELLLRRLLALGVNVVLRDTARSYREEEGCLQLASGQTLDQVDRVLIAVGREPNLDLGLDDVGVTWGPGGVETDGLGRTSQAQIYAIGDINPRSAFTHSANHQGRRLVQKLAFPWLPVSSQPYHYPSATFTDPEVAQVGPPLERLKEQYCSGVLRSHLIPLRETDRGYTSGEPEGFVLLHALALTGRLLSATVVAPAAGEMLPLLTLAVNDGISMYRLSNLVFPYPVLSEAIKKAADQYVFGTLGKLPKEAWSWLRFKASV